MAGALDTYLRVRPYNNAGTELLTRGNWQAGSGVEFSDDPDTKRTIITSTGGGSGTAVNLGAKGVDVYKEQVGSERRFRKVRGSSINANDEIEVGLEFDLRDYGGACDSGSTNNSTALAALLADIESYTPFGAESAGKIVINLKGARTETYHFPTQVTITQYKNIELRSDGAIISSDVDYPFLIDAANGVKQTHIIRDLLFYQCGIDIDEEVVGYTELRNLKFYQAPAAGIHMQATTGVPGTGGSVIGGRIINCRFDGCYNGVVVDGDQSDLWEICGTWFVRGLQSDIVMWSTGFDIHHCDFESRNHTTGSALQPFIQVRGTGRTGIYRNRFGNETSGSPTYKPPKYAIVFGDPGAAETDFTYYNQVWGNKFEGYGSPSTTAAFAAINYQRPPVGNYVNFADGHFRTYHSTGGRIHLTHSNLRRGYSNNVVVNGRDSASLWCFAETKVVRGASQGWNVQGAPHERPLGAAARPLLDPRLDTWSTESATVAQDAMGPDGLTNSAYTISRTASGDCRVYANVPTSTTGKPITISCWLRTPDSVVTTAYMFVDYGGTPLTDFNATISIDTGWRKHEITIVPPASQTLTVSIYSGVDGDSATTGDIEVFGLEVCEGYASSDRREENFDATGSAAVQLAPKLVASGTATASSAATVSGALEIEEGWTYKLTCRITGTSETDGHQFLYEGYLDVSRPTSGTAYILGATVTQVQKTYYDLADGSVASTGEADPADVTITIAQASNTITFDVDNADSGQDLENVRIWVSWDRELIAT